MKHLLLLLALAAPAVAQLKHNVQIDGISDGVLVNNQMMLTIVGRGDIATFIDPGILPGATRIRLRVITAVALDSGNCRPWFHDESMDIFSWQSSIALNQVTQSNFPMQFNPYTGLTTTWRLDYNCLQACQHGAPQLTGVLCIVETY